MMYTTPGDPRFKEVEETINFQLRFPERNSGELHVELWLRVAEPLPGRGNDGLVEHGAGDGLQRPAHAGATRQRRSRRGTCRVVDHFAAEMDHMSDCVMQNKEPLTPGEEGLRDLTIMMAIYEAANTGKTVKL